MEILSAQSLSNPNLLHYLVVRDIPLSVAKAYCSEVLFQNMKRTYYAIGFENDALGTQIYTLLKSEGSKMLDLTQSPPGNVMRDFPCESQAFPVSRQKHYSAHFVLHCPNTGRGAQFHRSAVLRRRALLARACVRVRHFSFFTFTLHPKKTNN